MSIQVPVSEVASPSAAAEPRPIAVPFQIGSVLIDPPILQAPMAGFTNYAYRQIVREYGGAGLLATEMVHATGMA
ncbi:MAG: tRNA-dihydrouridine synthase, partial [Planctomycetaceae bacterium]|nr:tRNA-dihydrouridine synthase [Planctomycetaceae bacterium]